MAPSRAPTLLPPEIMTALIIAAPALDPETTAPSRHRRMRARYACVSLPWGRKTSRTRLCTPPVKK